ncbi:MAG: Pyoverdin chromophore biosynthetic protein pvcC [Ardenticatenales bacterium]|nr:Pyoverdin chromophore biosynthetic protein pvcC [Ardenticatenales bacterium]
MSQPLPFTGAEYLQSLQDDREVWIYGRRVADVSQHPAFRNSARMVARLYDASHDPANTALRAESEFAAPFTHPFFRLSRSREEMVAARDAIAGWQRLSYGWMGRSPDYKASFIGTLGANAEFFAPFADNARRWYQQGQERLYYVNHAIVNPPIDRDRPETELRDILVRVEKETDSGLILSGAKVVATASALTHYNFIAHYGLPIKEREFAVACFIPMNAPGVKLICRHSYEFSAAAAGSPFDFPLSSRLDENDAIFVLDKVFVPWEDVLIYGDVAKFNRFAAHTGFFNRLTLHGCTRLAVKLDFLCGLLLKATRATGSAGFRGVQVQLGEALNWRHLFWSLSDAMCHNPDPWLDGAVLPNLQAGLSYRMLMSIAYPKIREIAQNVVASGLIYLPSSNRDFASDIAPYLQQYVRGSGGMGAEERVKILKLLWDAVGTEFAGRHELYERNYAGNHEAIRLEPYLGARGSGLADELEAFVDSCLGEYDLNGWQVPDLFNPDDITALDDL